MRSDDIRVPEGPHLQESGARRIDFIMPMRKGAKPSVIFNRWVAIDALHRLSHLRPLGGARVKCVLFVEDHPIYRDGVRRTLEAAITDLTLSLIHI